MNTLDNSTSEDCLQIQNLLEENNNLIKVIENYDRNGRILDTVQLQQKLHGNLMSLAHFGNFDARELDGIRPPSGLLNSVKHRRNLEAHPRGFIQQQSRYPPQHEIFSQRHNQQWRPHSLPPHPYRQSVSYQKSQQQFFPYRGPPSASNPNMHYSQPPAFNSGIQVPDNSNGQIQNSNLQHEVPPPSLNTTLNHPPALNPSVQVPNNSNGPIQNSNLYHEETTSSNTALNPPVYFNHNPEIPGPLIYRQHGSSVTINYGHNNTHTISSTNASVNIPHSGNPFGLYYVPNSQCTNQNMYYTGMNQNYQAPQHTINYNPQYHMPQYSTDPSGNYYTGSVQGQPPTTSPDQSN